MTTEPIDLRSGGPAPSNGSASTGDATPAPATTDGLPTAGHRSALALAAVLVGAGVMHFVVPGFYERIVPRWIGHEAAVVRWSGVAELATGALVVLPKSRRIGAWLALATFVGVYPANLQMALDTGRPTTPFEVGVWLRLPLQFPLFVWAYRCATR